MKIEFNKSSWLILAMAGALAGPSARAAEASNVLSPTKRQEALDQAKQLLAPREAKPPAADPFHSEAFNELVGVAARTPGPAVAAGDGQAKTPAVTTGPRSAHDLLQAIAAGLKPSGSFVMGGQPHLLFGQKRVKAGGFVTINFEGAEYTVEIASINAPNFTLRLNREEFTRPIK